MFYELRTYTLKPTKLADWLALYKALRWKYSKSTWAIWWASLPLKLARSTR